MRVILYYSCQVPVYIFFLSPVVIRYIFYVHYLSLIVRNMISKIREKTIKCPNPNDSPEDSHRWEQKQTNPFGIFSKTN